MSQRASAVYIYEILKQPERAIETAKSAFDDAIGYAACVWLHVAPLS